MTHARNTQVPLSPRNLRRRSVAIAKRSPALLIVVGVVMLLFGVVGRATDGVGAVFDLGVSARSLGVGGARAAFADDASASTLNPASLGWVKQMGVGSLYMEEFGGASYGSLAFAAPYVGLSTLFVDSGWISSGDSGFRFAAQGLTVSAAVPVGPVAGGLRWRFLRYGQPFEAHGWALDAGLLARFGPVKVGAILDAAVSAPMAFAAGSVENWIPNLCLGVALTLTPYPDVTWITTVDVEGVLHGPIGLRGGSEAWVGPLAARLGWDGDGPTFGLSVRVLGFEVDWSCAVRSDLGVSHRVSLEVLF